MLERMLDRLLIDHFLTRWHWYRRLRGGIWFHVTPRPFPYMELWTRAPISVEHVNRVEADGRDIIDDYRALVES